MEKNEILTSKVANIVKGYASEVYNGSTVDFDRTISMEIENGEQIIGYQYLHGTSDDVGGFGISGNIQRMNMVIQLLILLTSGMMK